MLDFNRLKNDREFRLFLTSGFSGGWNFAYAVFNFALAAVYESFWFLTLGVYYFFFGCMRMAVVAYGRGKKDRRTIESVVRHIGIALCLLSVVFSGTVVLSIMEQRATAYNIIVMISLAAFTFYLFTMAIINIIKAHKNMELREIALRNISMCGAFVSMFSLEKSMLATFSEGDASFAFYTEVLTGAAVFILIILLGINLIKASFHK